MRVRRTSAAIDSFVHDRWLAKTRKWIGEHGGGTMIPFSIEWEQKASAQRDDEAKLAEYVGESVCKSALPKMVITCYKALKLVYFFTAGEKELRCWTMHNGGLVPQAAGIIHSDFERGFIKAEVVAFDDLKAISTCASMAEVKAAGKYRQEGKAYFVKDGDIIHFMFNVTVPANKKCWR